MPVIKGAAANVAPLFFLGGLTAMAQDGGYETLLVEREDAIAIVTLNRPKVLNALCRQMILDLMAVLDHLAEDAEVRVVILTGAGRAFCAGLDLAEQRQPMTQQRIAESRELATTAPLKFLRFPKPLVAAINGIAVGAGVDMTLPCDIRIASESAKLSLTFTRVGLIPEFGGTYMLPRILGLGKALELVLTGRTLEAREAAEIGLVNKVVAPQQLLDEAREMARMTLKSTPLALQLSKQAIHSGINSGFVEATQLEVLSEIACMNTADFKEALKAFAEKREPKFTGR
jgi:enoyl-CoA hydratase/carnithine racemase